MSCDGATGSPAADTGRPLRGGPAGRLPHSSPGKTLRDPQRLHDRMAVTISERDWAELDRLRRLRRPKTDVESPSMVGFR